MFEGLEHLLGDVVETDGVLQGEVELVVVLDHVPAVVPISKRSSLTAPVPTPAVYVDGVRRQIFLQLSHQVLSPTVGLTVGDKPGRQLLLLLPSSPSLLLILSSDNPAVGQEDVGVVSVGHGEVEEVVPLPQLDLTGVGGRLQCEKDVELVR